MLVDVGVGDGVGVFVKVFVRDGVGENVGVVVGEGVEVLVGVAVGVPVAVGDPQPLLMATEKLLLLKGKPPVLSSSPAWTA